MRNKGVLVFPLLALVITVCAFLYWTKEQNVLSYLTENRKEIKNQSNLLEKEKVKHWPSEDDRSLPDDFPNLQFIRKYGQSILRSYRNRTTLNNLIDFTVDRIPKAEELAGATADQLIALFHSYLDNVDYLCHRKLRMGAIGDGGWEICDDFEYRPIKPCIIYSFGINNDFSFDDDAGKVYGCRVVAFDPSMNTATHKRSDQVYFYKIGIRGEDNSLGTSKNWEMATFSGIRAMLNTTQGISDVVKMDVEDSEWDSLTLMAKEGQLESIRQLLIEYHFGGNNGDIGAMTRRLNVLRLVEDHGFRRFYVHKNPACGVNVGNFPVKRTVCYEIHYVNIRLRRSV